MSKAIAKKEQVYSKLARRSDELMKVLEKVAIDDAKVSLAAAKAFKFTRKQLIDLEKLEPGAELDVQLKAYGITFEELQIALEARRPKSETSVAIIMAHERTGMRIRKAEETSKVAAVVNIVFPAPRSMTAEERSKAPVIDVDER